jgi:glyoxylase-like metal-dependent hydrolase (beta-lactamase superfamily II)
VAIGATAVRRSSLHVDSHTVLENLMFRTTLWRAGICLAFLFQVAVSTAGNSEWREQRGRSGDPNPLAAQLIKTGLYMLSGEGNSLIRLSANGAIVVDGQAPGHFAALRQQARRIGEQPVRLLITTDHHQEHTANNAQFLAEGAQIAAHENVKRRLAAARANRATIGLPTKTYGDHLSLTLGGVSVRLMHFGNAHTDGDSVVYFPDLKVVAIGHLFASPPDPDFSSGGSLVGWGSVLGEILKLDFDVVVPSRGSTMARADLVAYKAKIDTLVARARSLVKKGVPKQRLLSELETADLGWRLDWTGERLERFYAELSRAP